MGLKDLQTAAEYQSERESVFASVAAVLWFQRAHRRELDEANALIVVNRRILIRPDRFDAVVLAVGERASRAGSNVHHQAEPA